MPTAPQSGQEGKQVVNVETDNRIPDFIDTPQQINPPKSGERTLP